MLCFQGCLLLNSLIELIYESLFTKMDSNGCVGQIVNVNGDALCRHEEHF
jgi:hypothetical protein